MPLDTTDELFYLVDESDAVLGSVTRKDAHTDPTKIHRSIGILLKNDKQEMLFQQRSLLKDVDPGMWTYAVGGHVSFGDTYEETADRELHEELGISVPLTFLTKVCFFTGKEYQMAGLFEGTVSSGVSLTLDSDEVSSIRWVPIDEMKEFIASNPVANWTIEALKRTGYLYDTI